MSRGIMLCLLVMFASESLGQESAVNPPVNQAPVVVKEEKSEAEQKAPAKPVAKSPVPKAPVIPKRVYSDLKQVDDPGFFYCGEFMGPARIEGALRNYGLQVAQKKNGEFVALVYQEGLPGDGWNSSTIVRSTGKLENNALKFDFSGSVIEVTQDQALVSHAGAKYVLKKLLRQSPSMNLPAPQGATVLFQHGQAHKLVNPKISPEGYLQEGVQTEEAYQDFRLHAEFKVPYLPDADDQARGNSGVYIQSRYEIQILDSFGDEARFNSIGALYRQKAADLNMALPPLSWQTYDIWFTAATFDSEGKKTNNARITVFLNGVPVHYDREIMTKTGAGKPEGATNLVTNFQNHSDPVRFRYIWVQPGKQALPANKLLSPHSINSLATDQTQTHTVHHSCDFDCEIHGYNRSSAYPYARPENYTREEEYGHYGKVWPF